MREIKMILDTLLRAQERFEDTLKQMNLNEANSMPNPLIKSVSWLMWHTSRELDYQFSELNKSEPLWISDGWTHKFNLDLPDDTQDYSHTPEQARKVVVSDKKLLSEYLNTSIQFVESYFETLDETSLTDIIDKNWTPPVTKEVRIVSAIDDAVMHSGQAVYTRRLVINK
ncbi:hypothetical protein [Enterococcus sp. AZ103]|uniref:hypothetical protein n=1 Tax=Enterococcus sp. AZ103 TaxID=2774628 RepID=UPI003F297331